MHGGVGVVEGLGSTFACFDVHARHPSCDGLKHQPRRTETDQTSSRSNGPPPAHHEPSCERGRLTKPPRWLPHITTGWTVGVAGTDLVPNTVVLASPDRHPLAWILHSYLLITPVILRNDADVFVRPESCSGYEFLGALHEAGGFALYKTSSSADGADLCLQDRLLPGRTPAWLSVHLPNSCSILLVPALCGTSLTASNLVSVGPPTYKQKSRIVR
jgi:hypothetical protein